MSDESKDSSPVKEDQEDVSDEEPMEDVASKNGTADTSKDDTADTSKDDTADTSKDDEDHNETKDDDEEESEEETIKPGLLEKPYILEKGSKRERKKVERLTFQSAEKVEKKQEIEEGKGEVIGDIPYAEFKISRTKADELKPLHRIMFGRTGTAMMVKKNIRKFSGFAFEKDDPQYEKKETLLKGKTYPLPMIKSMCEVLNVPRAGTKNEVIDNLLSFLLRPEDTGRKVPAPKRKRKSKGEGEKKKRKSSKKKKVENSKKKAKKVSDDDDDDEEEEEEDIVESEDEKEDDDDKEDSESEASDVESEEEAPPKKKVKKNTPKAKPMPKAKAKPKEKTKEKKEAKPKKEVTKSPAKKKSKSAVAADVSDISSSSSNDDEPLIKHKDGGPPTNETIKEVIKKMLDVADLEEVTMKTVLKGVNAKFPEHDLSDRKEFIKNTVKQIIS